MKLYVWNMPFQVSYGGSILYVLARDIRQARKAARTAVVSHYGYDPQEQHPLPDLGEPDRVLSAPYAEVYRWSE